MICTCVCVSYGLDIRMWLSVAYNVYDGLEGCVADMCLGS